MARLQRIVPAQPLRRMGGRRKHPCSIAQRERQQTQKARLLGKLQVESACSTWASKSRTVWSLPGRQADLLQAERPEADGLRMEAGLRPARRSLAPSALMDRKAPAFQRMAPTYITSDSIRSGKAVHFGRCRPYETGPSAAPVQFQLHPTCFELDRAWSFGSACQVLHFRTGGKGIFRYLSRRQEVAS